MGRHRKLVMPDDFSLAICNRDRRTDLDAGYVVQVGATGPVRITYTIEHDKRAVMFLHHAPISERRREELFESAMVFGVLDPEATSHRQEFQGRPWMSAYGWLESRFVPLGASGMFQGWAVVADLESLVPPVIWRHLSKRRDCWVADTQGSEEDKELARLALDLHAIEAGWTLPLDAG